MIYCPNCGGTIFDYDIDYQSVMCYMCGIHLNHELFEREIPRRLAESGRHRFHLCRAVKQLPSQPVIFTARR